jgi:hypothetical protein
VTLLILLGVAVFVSLAIFCIAVQIATKGLEEREHEPEPTAPHRPVW